MTDNSPTCILSNSSCSIHHHQTSSPLSTRRSHHRRHHHYNHHRAPLIPSKTTTCCGSNNSPAVAAIHNRRQQQYQLPLPPIIVDSIEITTESTNPIVHLRSSGGGSTSEDEDRCPKSSSSNRRSYSLSSSSSTSNSRQQQQASPSSSTGRARSPVASLPLSNSSKFCGGSTAAGTTSSRTSRNTLSLPTELDRGDEEDDSSTSPNNSDSQKSPKSSKVSAWKTSKFFSKSMTSSDLLKGLKKLSLSSSTSNSNEDQQQPTEPQKSLRSRITNFKRRPVQPATSLHRRLMVKITVLPKKQRPRSRHQCPTAPRRAARTTGSFAKKRISKPSSAALRKGYHCVRHPGRNELCGRRNLLRSSLRRRSPRKNLYEGPEVRIPKPGSQCPA